MANFYPQIFAVLSKIEFFNPRLFSLLLTVIFPLKVKMSFSSRFA